MPPGACRVLHGLEPGLVPRIGVGGGTGCVIEYRGSAIRALSMEQRMTVCNMSIEGGARAGLVAPDDITYQYLHGRAYAPKGAAWEAAYLKMRGSGRCFCLPPFQSPEVLKKSCPASVAWGTSVSACRPYFA